MNRRDLIDHMLNELSEVIANSIDDNFGHMDFLLIIGDSKNGDSYIRTNIIDSGKVAKGLKRVAEYIEKNPPQDIDKTSISEKNHEKN